MVTLELPAQGGGGVMIPRGVEEASGQGAMRYDLGAKWVVLVILE